MSPTNHGRRRGPIIVEGRLASWERGEPAPVAALLWGRNGFDRVRKRNSASGLDTALTVQKQ